MGIRYIDGKPSEQSYDLEPKFLDQDERAAKIWRDIVDCNSTPAFVWQIGHRRELIQHTHLPSQRCISRKNLWRDNSQDSLVGFECPSSAYLQGKRDGSTQDEALAWDSRKFLRKLCIGKVRLLELLLNPAIS